MGMSAIEARYYHKARLFLAVWSVVTPLFLLVTAGFWLSLTFCGAWLMGALYVALHRRAIDAGGG